MLLNFNVQCLGDWTYTYSVTATDNWGLTTSTVRTVNISLPNMGIWVPISGLNFASIPVSYTGIIITQQFTGSNNYFSINDTKGFTGRRTTIQLSGSKMVWTNNPNKNISWTNIEFKGSWSIDLISWDINTNVHLATWITNYQIMTWVLDYMIKDYWPSCSSCVLGNYGNLPNIKINIPWFQTPDSYKWTLIFDLIE